MTTTPTASPGLLDLEHLEALARAATPGPWVYQEDSDAYTHIVRPAQSPGRIVRQYTQDTSGVVEANARFTAGANPAAVLALIAAARRAQPEGEAPQAELRSQMAYIAAYDPDELDGGHTQDGMRAACRLKLIIERARAALATLSPLCGAQHAESGKEDEPLSAKMHDVVVDLREYAGNPGYSHGDYADTMHKAANTIEALRAQFYHWGPALATQQAAAPGALAVLFDGHAVYSEITRKLGKAHCHSHETVSETLDAVVRLLRSAPSHTTNKEKGGGDGHVLDR